MRDQDPSNWHLNDDQLGALASAKVRTVEGRGKADIGGRMRVAAILRKAGIAGSAPPERIAGSTNEVWRAGDLIVRVGSIPGAGRLRREAKLVNHLPWGINYPSVVAAGVEPFGEWLIVKNRSGIPLSDAWTELDRPARRRLVHELAEAVKEIHEVVLPADIAETLAFDARSEIDLPHQLLPVRLRAVLNRARELPWMDLDLINALSARLEEVADVYDGASVNGLIHGDLHFENVLVRNSALVSILDFEWSRVGPREVDLDVLARFCMHPDLTVGAASKQQRDSYRPVLAWFNEAYPELFSAPRLKDRLMLCALAAEVPWLLHMPPTGPQDQLPAFHPVNRLHELLESGTAAERLGWVATGI